ncbi:MAG: YkgJ family cysteine cluster protein [Alphaproteobacteria bacterium]|nr:YkgJ family cysteine cluster protein [Alphaproteobacteria bacterium]
MDDGALSLPAEDGLEAFAARSAALAALSEAVDAPIPAGWNPDDPLPAGIAGALERFFAAYDDYLAVVLRSQPTRCVAGCHHCCADNPRGSTGVELAWVARAAAVLPDAAAVADRARAAAARWTERLARLGSDDAAVAETKAARDLCPLLGADGRCRVYAARPVACRMFFALTAPDWCQQTHPRHPEARNPHFTPPWPAREMLMAVSARLGLGEAAGDLRTGLVERLGR